MRKREDLTQARLREVLDYNSDTGLFTRKVGVSNSPAGAVPGKIYKGYREMNVDGFRYFAHRLVWRYVTGEWPDGQIDHINGVRDDNRFENLRVATNTQNAYNSRKKRINKSGFKGVSRSTHGRWQAQIRVNGKNRGLGLFDTPEEAHAAYIAAAEQYHGEFARA